MFSLTLSIRLALVALISLPLAACRTSGAEGILQGPDVPVRPVSISEVAPELVPGLRAYVRQEVQERIGRYDRDGDGQLSKTEEPYWGPSVDGNGDGFFTFAELYPAHETLALTSMHGWGSMAMGLDRNQDQRLTWAELGYRTESHRISVSDVHDRPVARELVQKAFETADLNQDGQLTEHEAQGLCWGLKGDGYLLGVSIPLNR